MKIATFSFAGFPGTNQSLRNLAQTTKMTRHFSVTSIKPGAVELEFFANHLSERKPALVIFGAWTPAYERILNALPPQTRVAAYWTSSPGQVDISGEAGALHEIFSHPRIHHVLFSSRLLARAFQSNPRCGELPSTFPSAASVHQHRATGIPVLSLFCAPYEYRRKNIFNTLLAVAALKREYVLYLNGLSEHPAYHSLLAALQISYKDWGWLNRPAYERMLAQVDIGLQVSFSESFGYVVSDHILRGIPVLASEMVPVMDGLPARVQERLIVENGDNLFEIARKLEYLLDHPRARRSLANAARRALLKQNEANIKQAKKTLQALSGQGRA